MVEGVGLENRRVLSSRRFESCSSLGDCSSTGRASVLHVGGYGFKSRRLHFLQYVTEWLTCPLWEREIEGSSPSVLKI